MLPTPLRPAELADVPTLTALINRAYRGAAGRGWTTEADLFDGPRLDAAALRELLLMPDSLLLKAEEEAGPRLIGCVHLARQGAQLYLSTLAVAPEAQAQGVGRQLLAAADAYASQQGCSKVKITVLESRPELLAWYERHGYRRTGHREPFPNTERFGRPRQPLALLALEKVVV